MSQKDRLRSTNSKKNQCGKCQDECASGNAVVCGFCEFWYHTGCIEGMSPEFVKCCDAINKFYGGSSFLCAVCRKITGMLNNSMKDMEAKMSKMEAQLQTAVLERKILAEKIENMENKNRQVKENVMNLEGEVTSGMEKAKEEVKVELRGEMREREEKRNNIVIYGLKESTETDGKKRKEEDEEKVKKMATEIDIEFKGEIRSIYRARPAAGKPADDRPCPLVVTIEDDETREGILANARRMAGKDEWKRVFVAHDLTWRQREEMRKEEGKLREDAEKRTKEANEKGDMGKCIVVGQRGKKWIKWIRAGEIREGQ